MIFYATMRTATAPRRILVIIPTATLTQRQLLEGLLGYTHESATIPWQLHLDLHDLNRQHLKDCKSWNCSGIIAYILSERERREILDTKLPAVLIEPRLSAPLPDIPGNVVSFINEHAAEGRTAADYFMKRRYTFFAYIGTAQPTFWSEERIKGYREQLGAKGFRPIVYPTPSPEAQLDFAVESRSLVRWLKSLPRPTALFCVHDRRAQQIIATASAAGLKIPQDLAVLGVDNDELLCEMTVPGISSIPVFDHERGREVGRAMDALLDGRDVERVRITQHDVVITRMSSSAEAISDPFVARAVEYACAHLDERPSLPALAKAAGCSKTVLNIHARRVLGRTISEELTRLQLDSAISRLADAQRTVEEIAQECGFCNASHLAMRLKSEYGHSPGWYRRK